MFPFTEAGQFNPNLIKMEILNEGWECIKKRWPEAKPFGSFVLVQAGEKS